jgi:hypothetical protein
MKTDPTTNLPGRKEMLQLIRQRAAQESKSSPSSSPATAPTDYPICIPV